MTAIDEEYLAELEAQAERLMLEGEDYEKASFADHVPELIAEVRRLQALVESLRRSE